jgi:hypothetical protein
MVVVVELELVVAEVAKMAHAAVAKLLRVAEGLVAEGLVAEEQKMGVDYNISPLLNVPASDIIFTNPSLLGFILLQMQR